ncbi:MAG: ComF family protein [Bavariicoccus seileri]
MKCVICDNTISSTFQFDFWMSFRPKCEKRVCDECLEALKKAQYERMHCRCCGQKISLINPDSDLYGDICSNCAYWKQKGDHHRLKIYPAYHYHGVLQELIQRFKTMGDVRMVHVLAPAIKKTSDSMLKTEKLDPKQIVIVPLVSSPKREEARGFNQNKVILEENKMPFFDILEHIEDDLKQSQQTKAMRLSRASVLKIKKEIDKTAIEQLIQDKTIILVDDVYTTGRTLHDAISCLLPYKPQQFFAVVLAH